MNHHKGGGKMNPSLYVMLPFINIDMRDCSLANLIELGAENFLVGADPYRFFRYQFEICDGNCYYLLLNNKEQTRTMWREMGYNRLRSLAMKGRIA